MMDPNSVQQLAQAVMNVLEYSPAGDAAKAVCMVRQIDPYQSVNTQFCWLPAWKGVIFEAALIDFMSRSLKGE